MKTKTEIRVLRKDINAGECQNPFGCPVARAIKRMFPQEEISVLPDRIEIGCNFYKTPRAVARFIKKFDAGIKRKELKPFAFALSPRYVDLLK